MEKVAGHNRSFDEIWDESFREAQKSFQTGNIEEIKDRYGIDEDEAECLDTLWGSVGKQIKFVNDRGKKIVLTASNVKTHEDEVYEVSTLGDWCDVAEHFGREFREHDSISVFEAYVRCCERTKGWYVPTVKIVQV